MYQRVLLTNDGSPLSVAAIPYAAAMARTQGADLILVRVSRAVGERPDAITRETWDRAIGGDGSGPTAVAVEAEPLLSEIASRLRAMGVRRVGTLVLHGTPGPAIVEATRRLDADLVIMSSHGLSGLKRAVMGSVAEHVVRNAGPVPVMICHPLPPGVGDVLDRIEVPLDGSTFADAAVGHAAAIASAARSSVVLVRAIDSVIDLLAASTPLVAGMLAPGISIESAEELVATHRAAVRDELAAVGARLKIGGVAQVRIEIVEQRPAAAILDVARRNECRVIVMSTHGRGGLGRALLGSVADDVARNFEGGAVLLVHAPARG